jgi:hypothetical protein
LHRFPISTGRIKLRNMRWAGRVVRIGEMRTITFRSVGKSEGERSLERPRFQWEDNIKMNLRGIACHFAVWIELAKDSASGRVLSTRQWNLRVPLSRVRGPTITSY